VAQRAFNLKNHPNGINSKKQVLWYVEKDSSTGGKIIGN